MIPSWPDGATGSPFRGATGRYLLSEPEEKIVKEKSVTGRQAWSRFFDEIHSSTLYDWDGAKVPQQALLTQLYAADRETRKKAAASLTRGLRENPALHDVRRQHDLRGRAFGEQAPPVSHLDNVAEHGQPGG